MSPLDSLLAEVAEEAIGVVEDALDSEQLDYDECSARDTDLCGAATCDRVGCLVDKRRRAVKALAKARGETA